MVKQVVMQTKKVAFPDAVFIPMYNCESQIPRVLSKFKKDTCQIFDEILIIDNGSTDSSLDSAKKTAKLLKNIKITILQNN